MSFNNLANSNAPQKHIPCICPKCGYTTSSITSKPCYEEICPKCKSPMTKVEDNPKTGTEDKGIDDLLRK